jgi:Mg2+-importing ATPase
LKPVSHFWDLSQYRLFEILNSGKDGLSNEEAETKMRDMRKGRMKPVLWKQDILLFLSQYKSPLVLLLVFAVVLSVVVAEYSNSIIIMVILLLTGFFGFIQERNAGRAVSRLKALVSSVADVNRNGIVMQVPIDEVVPGDIVLLKAGDIVPADGFLLEANDLHINEAALTGESFPAEKFCGSCKPGSVMMEITNAVFKGTNVVNGTATVLAVNTGEHTEMGRIAAGLAKAVPETAFEKGVRKFGYLLMRITIVISVLILVLNILLQKPVIDSFLFALALAVGLAPELLPAIITVTLSAGARRLAGKKVIVKKLNAIQNLGEMDILCSDKTGTLTEGVAEIHSTVGSTGSASEKVKLYAYLNAFFETGFPNPIDEAIRKLNDVDSSPYSKKDEVPYDFIRKRLSVVVRCGDHSIMITKGAVNNILECCSRVELPDGTSGELEEYREAISALYLDFSGKGFRTIGICYKDVTDDPVIDKDDECAMIFLGFITVIDPLKKGIPESIGQLRQIGIGLRIITGDNRLVAEHLCSTIGIDTTEILTGRQVRELTAEALQQKVNTVHLFAEIEPIQKERIIRALQKNGHVVGYLGDGINDANALRVADTGISIENAVDVAKEAASVVLLEKDMDVIAEAVLEGRKTFTNTMKYIFVTTSANFGNMISMAIASLFLPFLPLLPIQILLNNFLSDIPSLTIASDNVDKEFLQKPRRWDLKYIKRFMIVFGLQSSVFDLLTFGILIFVYHASPEEFRTAWFMESLLTEILILLVVRTQKAFFRSRPSRYLLLACAFTFGIAVMLPYLNFVKAFELYPLPPAVFSVILIVALLYAFFGEITKKALIRRI